MTWREKILYRVARWSLAALGRSATRHGDSHVTAHVLAALMESEVEHELLPCALPEAVQRRASVLVRNTC